MSDWQVVLQGLIDNWATVVGATLILSTLSWMFWRGWYRRQIEERDSRIATQEARASLFQDQRKDIEERVGKLSKQLENIRSDQDTRELHPYALRLRNGVLSLSLVALLFDRLCMMYSLLSARLTLSDATASGKHLEILARTDAAWHRLRSLIDEDFMDAVQSDSFDETGEPSDTAYTQYLPLKILNQISRDLDRVFDDLQQAIEA